jgi:hypothetical protein
LSVGVGYVRVLVLKLDFPEMLMLAASIVVIVTILIAI